LDKTARQFIHSWIKKIVPMEDEWRKVTYMVFDSPPPITIFADGIIDNVNFKKVFKGCREYWYQSKVAMDWIANPATIYKSSQAMIAPIIAKCDQQIVRLHEQHELPFAQHLALKVLENNLSTVVDNGGEGLIVRDPNKCYECCRSHFLLKMKPFDDMEGTVIGYTTGRETDKGSRLLGKMGALIVRLPNGSRLELSGFTDQERELGCIDSQPVNRAKFWANNNPEAEVPDWIQAEMFPRGTVVTFKYRGLSADGIPIEARYWRKR